MLFDDAVPDEARYARRQKEQQDAWEAQCRRCGASCGVLDGDPCEHLGRDTDGKYRCAIYDQRFGLRKTVSGREFQCVPIRNILHKSWPGREQCGYYQGNLSVLAESRRR